MSRIILLEGGSIFVPRSHPFSPPPTAPSFQPRAAPARQRRGVSPRAGTPLAVGVDGTKAGFQIAPSHLCLPQRPVAFGMTELVGVRFARNTKHGERPQSADHPLNGFMPSRASSSARSLSGCPSWPLTQCHEMVWRAMAWSSACQSSTFFTGFLSAVFQPFFFQP